MIKQVHLKNFRCFRDVTVELDPFTVLIGKNDTGKTSFLDAMGFIANAEGAKSRAFDPDRDVLHGLPRDSIVLRATFQIGRREVEPQEIVFGTRGESFSSKPSPKAPDLMGMTRYKLQVDRLKSGSAVGGYYGSRPLGAFGDGIAAVLDRILSEHTEEFEVISRELSDRAPQVAKLRLRTRPSNSEKVVGFDLVSGARIDASQASDGLMLLLAFLTVVHDEYIPPAILVEEPENGIHPKQLREVLRMLYSLTQRKKDPIQVILTTHSPYVLDFVPPSCVRVFRRDPESGDVEVLPFAEMEPIKEMLEGGYTPGEAWYNSDEDHLHREKPKHASPRAK